MSLRHLSTGKYTLTVAAPGFTLYENDNVVIADQPLRLNVPMTIEVEQQKVQVSDTTPTIDVNPANNAGAIVISGKELEALPDDPDELQSDLEALAGPSAGPNGGQMYIDGFTAGQLPPKSSIREIRINQNPFSSEYDKLGYGRIEIFTKPGTDKYHGQFFVLGNDSVFQFAESLRGRGATLLFDAVQRKCRRSARQEGFVLFQYSSAGTSTNWPPLMRSSLTPSLAVTPLVESIPNPRQRTNFEPSL